MVDDLLGIVLIIGSSLPSGVNLLMSGSIDLLSFEEIERGSQGC